MTFGWWTVFSRLLAVSSIFWLDSAGFAAQRDRIRGPIDEHESVILRGNIHRKALPENDRGALDSATLIHGVKLVLGQTDRQASDLEQFLEAQRDPSSPDYRNWLSPEQYAERFGASENDLANLQSWLESHGLVVEQVARARNWIAVTGSAGRIAAAFRTELHHYEVGGEKHFANAAEPSIPSSLAGLVIAIRGLDDFHPKPQRASIRTNPDFNATNSNHYVAPDDLAIIYDIQALYQAGYDGFGQKIVIAGQTGIKLADVRGFRTTFNLPMRDPQLVLAGADPGTSPNDQIEADLDLEWSGAIARNATIIYVYSHDVFDSVQYAIDQNLAPVISVSYGGCETWAPATYRTMAQQANAQGITWMNASGDSGPFGCDNGGKIATSPPSTTFPADVPEITAVGGTEFNEAGGTYWSNRNSSNLASAVSWIPEKAWNDTSPANGLAAGGGGVSKLYTKPWWQTGPGVPNDQARDVPDVSLNASGAHDSYVLYANGGLMGIGGTSAAAPAFAGIVAILNQYLVATGAIPKAGLGNLNPSLYSLAQNTTGLFHDITAGDNIVPCAAGVTGCASGSFGYKAGPGYDLATGLGSVDAWNLVTKWAALPPSVGTTLALSATPAAIQQSATAQLTATVSVVSGTNTPAGNVAFTLGGISLGSVPVTGSGATAAASLQVKGSLLGAGANTITASYSGTGGFSGSTASAVVTVTAPPMATSITISANPASIAQTASTVLTATVKPASGSAVPAGSVVFSASGNQIGTAALIASAGSATTTLTVKGASLAIGANTIVATYPGGSGFGSSSSAALTVTVTVPLVPTTVALAAAPAAILQTASTVLTATVKVPSGTAQPTGTVTFTLGNTTLGTTNLSISNAAATAIVTAKGASLAIGQNSITAAYSGSSGFSGSSGTTVVTVTAPASPSTLTVVANPATIAPSSSTLITATVKVSAAVTVSPGSVTLAAAGNSLGSVPVTILGNSGTARLTVKGSSLATGPNNITAIYTPAGGVGGAASSVIVNVATTAFVTANMTLTASPAIISRSASTQLAVTVRASSATNPPTGSVTFAAGKTTLGAVAVIGSGSTATAKFLIRGTSLVLGNNLITATYVGPGFAPVTGSVTVNVTSATAVSR